MEYSIMSQENINVAIDRMRSKIKANMSLESMGLQGEEIIPPDKYTPIGGLRYSFIKDLRQSITIMHNHGRLFDVSTTRICGGKLMTGFARTVEFEELATTVRSFVNTTVNLE